MGPYKGLRDMRSIAWTRVFMCSSGTTACSWTSAVSYCEHEASISEVEMYNARSQNWSADGIFEREWAASLLRQTLDRLAQEYALAGKAALFEALKVRLAAGAAA